MGKLIQSSAEPEKVLCPICHCLTPLDLVAENKFGTNLTPVRLIFNPLGGVRARN